VAKLLVKPAQVLLTVHRVTTLAFVDLKVTTFTAERAANRITEFVAT
jgi:hypothetical protein